MDADFADAMFGSSAATEVTSIPPPPHTSDPDAAAEHASADFLDFEMAMFNNGFSEASHHQQSQAGFMAAMDEAVFGSSGGAAQFDAAPQHPPPPPPQPPASSMSIPMSASSGSDCSMMMDLLDAGCGSSDPKASPSDCVDSPWGSLPSEPKVMRTTTRHRRVSSIGAAGGGVGDDKFSHRRSLSFHTMPVGNALTGAEHATSELMASQPQLQQQQLQKQPPAPFRPSHRRGQSLGGHALHSSAGTPSHSFASLMTPPIPRPTSFPSATNSSHHRPSCSSHDDLLPWPSCSSSTEQSPFTNTTANTRRTPPRASLPDILAPVNCVSQHSPAGGGGARKNMAAAAHIGHRRGYSIGTAAPDTTLMMLHAPLSRDLAGARQQQQQQLSADTGLLPNPKTPSSSSARSGAMHARQLAMGHRRGQSLGHAYINTPANSASSSSSSLFAAHSSMPNLYIGVGGAGLSPGLQPSQYQQSQQRPPLAVTTTTTTTTTAPISSSSCLQNTHPHQHHHNHHHARLLSLQSQPFAGASTAAGVATTINSASSGGACGASASAADMDPQMLETFVNMHLQNGGGARDATAESFRSMLDDAGGVGVESSGHQIRAQEMSILNELQGSSRGAGPYAFSTEEFASSSSPMVGDKLDHQHFFGSVLATSSAPQQHQQQQQQAAYVDHLNMQQVGGAQNYHLLQQQQQQQQQHAAAVAAEGMLFMRPKLEEDEDDASVSGEDDEDDESAGEVERRCQWVGCDALFKSSDELVAHVSDLHIGAGKPSYTCQWNGCTREQRPFTKRHKIANHLRIHTGERPFECPVADCGKKFSRQDGLNTHIKTHSNIKPYVCTLFNCGKAYYHARSLRKHEKTHFAPTIMSMGVFQPGNPQSQYQQADTTPATVSSTGAGDAAFVAAMQMQKLQFAEQQERMMQMQIHQQQQNHHMQQYAAPEGGAVDAAADTGYQFGDPAPFLDHHHFHSHLHASSHHHHPAAYGAVVGSSFGA
ncbi:hypothetical protein HDU86_004687 [Geranomyces michiganensis]|nr:hypothetical protein HDU86_004687 [Geranomyces michiganensis]